MSSIVNSAAGNTYFTAAGSAIDGDSQPDVNGGAMKGARQNDLSVDIRGVEPGNKIEDVLLAEISSSGTSIGKISASADFPYLADGTYVIRGSTSSLAGLSSDVLKTAAADRNREAVHSVKSLRTTRVATAIRAGNWNPYTASFSSLTAANDFSAIGTDEAVTKAEFTYRDGSALPINDEYDS